jgi:NADH:ubiquinone oxidoreductase subunit 5 (subunit L)/multisubunit Na+/H+ antiporter MnhA subunit
LAILPSLKIDALGRSGIWQNNFLSRFYEAVFIRPLKLFGRILWLAFDVMVVERSIIASISHLSKTTVSGMHKIQENSKYSYILGVVIGILIMVVYFFKDIYK